MERLDVAEPVLGVIPAGENWHLAPAGSPEHARLTLLSKVPPISVAPTVRLAFCPASTATAEGETESVKSSPFPLSEILCGLPRPLSIIKPAPEAGPPT